MRRAPRPEVVQGHAISKCRFCRADIAWVYTSSRNGRRYPTNIYVHDGELVTMKIWFHRCETATGVMSQEEKMAAAKKVSNGVDHGNLMRAKFAGTCVVCKGRISAGEGISYDRVTKKATHAACVEISQRKAELEKEAEKFNEKWAELKNEFAEQERKQEEKAFMSDPDFIPAPSWLERVDE